MISFIIPAHNAAEYIERAVSSIEDGLEADKQLDCVEIIIVENGSTDETLSVASRLASRYNNLKVLRSATGASAARNTGIESAGGEWIFFLDADDYILDGKINQLISDSKELDTDWILYGHVNGSRTIRLSEERRLIKSDQTEAARVEFISNPTRYLQAWAKLFRRDIIVKNGIRFDQQLKLAEDSDFSIRYSACCGSMMVSDSVVYNYSVDNVSTMRSSDIDKINNYILSMTKTGEYMVDEAECIRHAYSKYVLMHFNIAMVRSVYDTGMDLTAGARVRTLKETSTKDIFREAFKDVKLKECTSPRMVPVLLIKLKCFRLAGLVYKIRARQNAKDSNNV